MRYAPLYCLFWLSLSLTAAAAPGPAAPGSAGEVQSLGAILAVARGFLEEQTQERRNVEITLSDPDPRLRLVPCEQPLEAYLPNGSRLLGNTLVGVRCRGAKPWSLFVQATVAVKEQVAVTRRPLARGATLGQEDVVLEERDIARLPGGYVTDLAPLIGQSVTRSVSQGVVLTPNMVEAARLVRRGERVTLLARSGALEVRMQGEALADGAAGEVVRVRNLSSRREVEGTVVGPGVVEVRM